ncbi:MAG: 2-hydroxyacid dehydrogenase [Hyphomicrobiales bacterium]|nr:2-hydroxyacid dehydrogenase [Hyphomicrobiales bacterium]
MKFSGEIYVLVPGPLNEHAIQRIRDTFRLEPIPTGDAKLVTPAMAASVRGVASMAPVNAALIDALPKLEIIANFGVGYDGVDAKHAAAKGIMVTNTPDVLTEEVADTALGLLINAVRELPSAERWLREGRWPKEGAYPLTGATLRDRRAGIFGLGRIGKAIASRLEVFGMPVAYHNRNPVEGSSYAYYPTLVELARAVDTLICVAPGGKGTEKAVNAEVLKALGPNGVFVNVGRGSSVDEDALAAALESGTIRAAGLDVFADEPKVPQRLLDAPHTCLLPHVGSASVYTRDAMADLQVDNLVSWFSEGKAITPVSETRHVEPKS